MLKGQ
jgi:hypothetical protein